MLMALYKQFKIACILLIIFSLLTGLLYPTIVTSIAELLFPYQANGSLMQDHYHNIIGSELIGQNFTDPGYFWGRPSATPTYPYNAENSAGSNLGPTNPDLLDAIQNRIALYHQADPENLALIPIDLITTSGSGLDPDISPLAAAYQIHRVANARNIPEREIALLVQHMITKRTFNLLGEPRVNVLKLNTALDELANQKI